MMVRLLLLAAVIAPLYSQDSDVAKYIAEIRAKSLHRDTQAERRELLAEFTKRLDITTDPAQKATLYLSICGIDEALGDSEAAIAAARSARLLQPLDTGIALRLAQVLIENRETAEATTLLGVDPTDGQALIRRAEELKRGPNLAVAVLCAELAHKLLPDDPDVTSTLGEIYMREGEAGLAGSLFLQEVARAPMVSGSHWNLALAYLQSGRRDDARNEMETALQLNPAPEERALIEQTLARLGLANPK
jgi:Flp pilus assembly protein TadD